MLVPGRVYNSQNFEYGFNGKRKENAIYGEGHAYDYGARIYDSRLGRWLSIDPLQQKYAGWSPYNYTLGNPIFYTDIDGRDVGISINEKTHTITFSNAIYAEGKTPAEVKKLNDEFESKYANKLKGTSSDGKWHVEIKMIFKVAKAADVIRIRANANGKPVAESLAQIEPGKQGSSTGDWAGNIMHMATDMVDKVDYYVHENMHNVEFYDYYEGVKIVGDDKFVLNWKSGKNIGKNATISISKPGYENDILGGDFNLINVELVPSSGNILTQNIVDALVNKALEKSKALGGAKEFVIDEMITQDKGKSNAPINVNKTPYKDLVEPAKKTLEK